jgi:hypothetical protein
MDLVPYLSAVILVSTIATILLAVLSYAAFKLRDKRKPKPSQETVEFFHRYRIEEDEAGSGGADGGA